MRKIGEKIGGGLFTLIFVVLFFPFCSHNTQAADKSVTLVTTKTSIEVDDKLEVKVMINTGGEKVSAIGFNIEFPTENLEGTTPNSSGTVFPMSGGTQSSTRYECGIVGRDGFTGEGLITTLVFKGKLAGEATINITNFEARYGPTGAAVEGFGSATLPMNVYGEGQTPVTPTTPTTTPTTDTSTTSTATPAEKITPKESTIKPAADATGTVTQKTISNTTGETKGSEAQVEGTAGATKEDVIKEQTDASVKVKGFSFNNPIYYAILPTILLLALVINLGIKLYFTEKRRHMDMVRLFDNHLGAISSLESKLDLVDQKEVGKEKILQEFEEAKNQIMSEENANLNHAKAS